MAKKSLFDSTERLLRTLLDRANQGGDDALDITDALKLVTTTTQFLAVRAKVNPEEQEAGLDALIGEFHGNGTNFSPRGKKRPQRDRDAQPLPAGAATLHALRHGEQFAADPHDADPGAAAPASPEAAA